MRHRRLTDGGAISVQHDSLILICSAGPSALLLAVSGWLTVRWLGQVRAGEGPFVRDTLWS